MAGPESPEANKGAEDPHENRSRLAASIERDFRSLVEIFDRMLQLTEESDLGAATALWTAQAAAKRGLQLSERLSKLADDQDEDG